MSTLKLSLIKSSKSYTTWNKHLFKTKQNQLLAMFAINKTTAAKLIVLWNLPALLLLAGAYEVGTTVFA